MGSKNEVAYGIAQWPPAIEIDYDKIREDLENLTAEERTEMVRRYIMARYQNSTRWQGLDKP